MTDSQGMILPCKQRACDRRLGALLSASATSCGARPPFRGVVLVASPDSGNLCLSDSMRLRVASRASCSKGARLWLRSQANRCNWDITRQAGMAAYLILKLQILCAEGLMAGVHVVIIANWR